MSSPELTLSKEQQSRVIGMVLGDGHIGKPDKSGKSQLVLRHSPTQLDYLEYKIELLKGYGIEMSSPRRFAFKLKGKDKTYVIYQSQSRRYRVLGKLRKKIYPKGRKTIRMSLLTNLAPIDLAIWYMDDGTLQRSGSSTGKYCGCKIATDCYSLDEQHIIIKALRRKFGLNARIHRKRHAYYIYFNMDNTIKLIDMCYPYMKSVKSLEYKWRAFYINNAKQRVQGDFESMSDRELKTRLFVKHYKFPNEDKYQDIELIRRYYGTIEKFETVIKLAKTRLSSFDGSVEV